MDNNQLDLNNLGSNISNLVDNAINSKNFKELNNTINTSINQAMNGVGQAIEGVGQAIRTGGAGAGANRQPGGNAGVGANRQSGSGTSSSGSASNRQSNSAGHTPFTNPYAQKYNTTNTRRSYDTDVTGQIRETVKGVVETGQNQLREQYPSGSVSGTIKALLGYTFGGFGGIVSIVALIMLLTGTVKPLAAVMLVIMGLVCVGGILLGYSGTCSLARIKRFRNYKTLAGPKAYIKIEDLSKATGKSDKYLLQDLQDMIDRRMFREGHIDTQKTTFMLNDQVYAQYQTMQKALEDKQRQDDADRAAGITDEVKKVLSDCDDYIKKIHKANDELPGEIISKKLSRLELVITRIMEEVKKQPAKAGELRKFMNYYLPTTWKLISTYLDFEKQPIQTENITSSKTEIEATLDTINTAFETLLDNLFQSKAWDISSDISVLNTMFAQEGLTKDSINKKEE